MAEFIFNNECTGWSPDKKRNEMYLKYQENWINIQLENRGYVFLRDIYETLGIQITKESCTNGWVYNGENHIVFELEELEGADYKIHVEDEGSIIDNF